MFQSVGFTLSSVPTWLWGMHLVSSSFHIQGVVFTTPAVNLQVGLQVGANQPVNHKRIYSQIKNHGRGSILFLLYILNLLWGCWGLEAGLALLLSIVDGHLLPYQSQEAWPDPQGFLELMEASEVLGSPK